MSPLHPHIIAVLGNSHCFMTFEHMFYMITYKILQYLLVSGKKVHMSQFQMHSNGEEKWRKANMF